MPLRAGAECQCFVIIGLHVEAIGGYIYYLTENQKVQTRAVARSSAHLTKQYKKKEN